MKVAIGAALAATAIGLAPAANADVGSYLNELHTNHQDMVSGWQDSSLIVMGWKACQGAQVTNPIPPMQQYAEQLANVVTAAAHKELCP